MAIVDLLLDLDYRPVVAHRGASGLHPENTMAAFAAAEELGADALELDVRLAADRVPMVHHDAILDRTTDATGPIARVTSVELAKIDAGMGEAIPRLDAVLDRFRELAVLIEIKEVEAAEPVLAAVKRSGAWGRVAIASFHKAALSPLLRSGIPLGSSRRDIAGARLRAMAGLRHLNGAEFHFHAVPYRWKGLLKVPTNAFVRNARSTGRPVHVWTVDDPRKARELWEVGVSGIITNRPDLIISARQVYLSGRSG